MENKQSYKLNGVFSYEISAKNHGANYFESVDAAVPTRCRGNNMFNELDERRTERTG